MVDIVLNRQNNGCVRVITNYQHDKTVRDAQPVQTLQLKKYIICHPKLSDCQFHRLNYDLQLYQSFVPYFIDAYQTSIQFQLSIRIPRMIILISLLRKITINSYDTAIYFGFQMTFYQIQHMQQFKCGLTLKINQTIILNQILHLFTKSRH